MTIAETERLRIRLLKRDDLDKLLEIWGDAETMKYCGGPGTREQEARSLDYYIKQQEERGFSPYGVELKATGELIGVCGFNPPSGESDAELIYHFNKIHWGRGYAKEAVGKTLDYAMDSLKIRIVDAMVDVENKASEEILKRNGFLHLGKKWCDSTRKEEEFYRLILRKE